MRDEEFMEYQKTTSKKLMWDNYFGNIGEDRQYKGQRQKNQMKIWRGIGTIKYPNGSVYQGQTMDGLYNGKGRLTHSNGDIYQGEWKNGFAHGKGTYAKVSEGVLYDGQYENDLQHGKGIEL